MTFEEAIAKHNKDVKTAIKNVFWQSSSLTQLEKVYPVIMVVTCGDDVLVLRRNKGNLSQQSQALKKWMAAHK